MRISGILEGGAEEGRDINTQIKGGETLKKQLAVIIGAILAISAVAVMPYCLAGAAISGGWVFHGNDGGYLHGLANWTRYDFDVGAGTDKWAYKGGVSNNPPSTANDPSGAIGSYSAISADDGTYETYVTTSNGNYAAQRFNFSISESASDISKINVTWNGKGWHDNGGTDNGATLYIWKDGTGYEQLDSTNLGTEVTLTGEKTSSISSYINAGNVTVLVEQKSVHSSRPPKKSYIATDYVRVAITP